MCAVRSKVLLAELEPTGARLFDRHLTTAKEWFPHEMVPWSRGHDFEEDEPFDPDEAQVPPAVRSALMVNLLTEDNLPHYFHTVVSHFGTTGVWGEWSRRWTAEEGRHSIVIRDYLTVTRSVDLRALERARMQLSWYGNGAWMTTRAVDPATRPSPSTWNSRSHGHQWR